MIVGTDGWQTGSKTDAGVIDANVVLAAKRTQIGPRNDVTMDRRPELYC